MANASKAAGQAVGKDLSYEEALKRLEAIVEAMESGELPLETLLARFEEGARLVKACQARLEEAELKISQMEVNAAGLPELKPAPAALTDDP